MKEIFSLSLISFLVLTIGLTGFVSAHTGDDDYGHHGMMGGFYGGGMYNDMGVFGLVFMILIITTLILFIIWLIKQIQNSPKRR